MNGERIFRALVVAKDDVIGLGMAWSKADTERVMSAIASGSYRLLPRALRDLLDRVARDLYENED